MKPIIRPTPLFFRPLLLPCILACCLILPASLAVANEMPGPKQKIPSEQSLLEELADRVRDRALFAANIAPEISRILKNDRYGYRYEDPDQLIDSLWALRSRPDIQKEWLRKLAAPGLTEVKKRQMLYEFEEFMEDIRYQAEKMLRREPAKHNLWTWLRRNVLRIDETHEDWSNPEAETPYQRALSRLDETKAREKAFADVLILADVYRKAGLDSREGEPYAEYFLELRDRPEDLKLAADRIRRDDLPRHKLKALLEALVKDPARARRDIADQVKGSNGI